MKESAKELLEGHVQSRFHVIVERDTPNGVDGWTEEWFSKKYRAVRFAERYLDKLPGDDRDTIGWRVIVYDSHGPRDNEAKRTTLIGTVAALPQSGVLA